MNITNYFFSFETLFIICISSTNILVYFLINNQSSLSEKLISNQKKIQEDINTQANSIYSLNDDNKKLHDNLINISNEISNLTKTLNEHAE